MLIFCLTSSFGFKVVVEKGVNFIDLFTGVTRPVTARVHLQCQWFPLLIKYYARL